MKHPLLALLLMMTPPLDSGETEDQKVLKAVDRLIKAKEYEAAIALLKPSLEESGDLSVRFKLAETYLLAKREDEALAELDRMQVELGKIEKENGTLSEKERELLKASNSKIDQIVRGGKELHELDKKSVRTYADFGRRMVAQKDYRSARLALRQINKLDPGGEEAVKLRALIQAEDWKDLTTFEITAKQHEGPFCINRAPYYAVSAYAELQKNGVQKCVFVHPKDRGQGFAVFRLPFPIRTFKASVAVISQSVGNAAFKIVVGDKEVYDSGEVRAGEAPKPVLVSFPSSLEIKLVTDSLGPYTADHCIWLDPLVR